MKKFLPTIVMSLGVMFMAGGGLAASASIAQAAPATHCAYPANSGLNTNGSTTVPATAGGTPGTCWTTNTIPGAAPVVVPTTTPDGTTVAPAASPAVQTASPNVQTASPAPIITTTVSSGLAFTGADIWQSVLVGLVLIGGGVFFVRLARRRRAHV